MERSLCGSVSNDVYIWDLECEFWKNNVRLFWSALLTSATYVNHFPLLTNYYDKYPGCICCVDSLCSSVPEGQKKSYKSPYFFLLSPHFLLLHFFLDVTFFTPSSSAIWGMTYTSLISHHRATGLCRTALCSVGYIVSGACGDVLSVMTNSVCWD